MKKLLIVGALALTSILGTSALTSCAPLLSTLQHDDATLIRAGGVITFSAGSTLAQDVAVYLTGVGLSAPASCTQVKDGIGCKLGDVTPDKPAILSVGGTISGSATYYRPGSNRPFIATLK